MKENELFMKNPPELIGTFERKPLQRHESTELPKSIQNAVKEKLSEELRRFDALNRFRGGAIY